jgi:prolyl-tRNA editing enzyme YbaK/EbsC (Cys-tRNA(Pro) deacylase)
MTEPGGAMAGGRPSSGRDRVLADAAARGLGVEIVERPGAGSLEEAAELLGIRPADIVKTLVVRRTKPLPTTYLFALVPGDRQIAWPRLRALVGANKLAMPEEALAIEATG